VKLRARIAVVITFVLLLFGLAAGAQANAAPQTNTNGCVVVPPLQLAVCINRF
jgi:hypothetical protein